MLTKLTINFLKNLESNNTREWFTENKKDYQNAYREFEVFIQKLIENISKFDSSVSHLVAKSCIFRIYRDVRFSKNKSPYKTNFGAHISSVTKRSDIHSRAGYYVHIELGGKSFLAGGAYMPESDWLYAIRQKIAENPKKFTGIVESKEFTKYFTFEGEKLKRPPQGFNADHPAIELLKHKSFLAMCSLSDKDIVSANFLTHATKIFKALKPFDDFLNGSFR